jgi:hypothetical protein
MACPLRMPDLIRLVRRLLPTVVLVVGILGSQGAVSAASVVAKTSPKVDDHARFCKCSSCSKDSCCCGPRKVGATSSPQPWDPRSPSASSVPCLNSAPCGVPLLPGASIAGPSANSASLCTRFCLLPVATGRQFSPCLVCILPSRRASRVDEPPEVMANA